MKIEMQGVSIRWRRNPTAPATGIEPARDEMGRVVAWAGPAGVAHGAGRVVHLRFTLKNTGLSVFHFGP